jgi:DNA-directed RNA polymerase subunit M/transcription elongation factor TFIIS
MKVVPDGRRGLTPYFGGAISEDKQSMNFIKASDEGSGEDKWVCPRCGYELLNRNVETQKTKIVDAFGNKKLRDILQIKPDDKRKFGVQRGNNNKLVVVSKDVGRALE